MNRIRFFALFAVALTLGFAALSVIPEEAEARRFGGGSSFGSRGSRSFSVPRQATPRSTMQQKQTTASRPASGAAAAGGRSGMGAGLMGGIGGLLLGGMIGSMLFGGGGGAGAAGGGGIGFLEILLIGGGIFFLMRWLKQRKAQANPASMRTVSGMPPGGSIDSGPMDFSSIEQQPGHPSQQGGGAIPLNQPVDEVTQGLEHIAQMDPSFQEESFLQGAKMAYQQIQGAWSDWSVDRLRPLLNDRMWNMVEAQAAERKAEGVRDIIEKIEFKTVEITEAWQESGENWITVRLLVSMIEYSTDIAGKHLEGSTDTPVEVEEYWTFTRPVNAQDPNWFLAAIQQSGEVARGSL
ncbi:MAG: Tim44 domain-containing protein [Magnetococcales bacterium]|nr:Tim44 domain-containing protein [Magnetococcales bacterium]